MPQDSSLESLASKKSLGRLVQEHPLRNQRFTRWGLAALALLSFLGAAASLAMGAYFTYERYYRNGPAVVAKDLVVPVVIAIALAIVGIGVSVRAYRLWYRSAALYECGFAYRDQRGVQVWRWEDLAGIRMAFFAPFTKGLNVATKRVAVLRKKTGEGLVLDNSLDRFDRLTGEIRRMVLPGLCAQAFEDLQQGKEVKLGSVEINQTNGLKVGKNRFSWGSIQAAEVQRGYLRIRIANTDGKPDRTVTIPAREIENLEVLLTVIEQYRPQH